MAALLEKLGATQSNRNRRIETKLIWYSTKAPTTVTFAHPILACAYAGFLSPELEIEVREVWLRYKSGDATLADEILEKASDEDNLWVARRAEGRVIRRGFTAILKKHGVAGNGYMLCTDAEYEQLFGGPAWKLRQRRGLPKRANVRNSMSVAELAYVAAAEALASERIEDVDAQGNIQCVTETSRSASFIRKAIEADRADRQRQPRLGGI